MSVRRVLVTGATGFVGTQVLEALQGRVSEVRALVRPTSDRQHLERLHVQAVPGSLESLPQLEAAVRGVDAVIHLAALTHARTEGELLAVNGAGTARVVEAIRRSGGTARLVYLSSLAAVGPARDRPVGPDDEPRPLTAYGRSKLEGERNVVAAADVEAVTLRAPAVYGPGDRELLRFFRAARTRILPVPAGPARPLQLVHVSDLARAVVDAALQVGLRGLYHIAEPTAYDWRTVCRMVAAAVGTRALLVTVPGSAISGAAAVSEAWAGMRGVSTMFNRDKARELLAPGWLCETDRALAAFGFSAAIALPDGLQSTADWYRRHGWL